MNTRFYNARILKTHEDQTFSVLEGELWVEGNRISYIGDGQNAPENKPSFDREIDAERNLLIPGFKNAHTHTAMTFLRSYADDLPLNEWLFNRVFPKEDQLTPEIIYDLDILGIMEYLTSGITANFDMYYFPPENAQASVDCGFRTVQCAGINDYGGTLELIEENLHKVNEMGELVSYIVGLHGEYTTSMKTMEGVADLAHKYKSPVFMHNAETEAEVAGCFERYGKSPTEVTNELDMYRYGGGGFHCVWMHEQDYEIFKEKNLTAIFNHGSNLKLASGIPPVKRFVDEGINCALGTDGAASNNCLDMFKEMSLAATLAKVREKDAECVSAQKILYMATAGGAKAMGLHDCDCLEEGKLADLVMIDLKQPNMQPENNLVTNLVYSGSKQNVKLTMVNGKILYENQVYHIGFEPEEVYRRANEIIRGMK